MLIGNTWGFVPDTPDSAQVWADGVVVFPGAGGWGVHDNNNNPADGVWTAAFDQTEWFLLNGGGHSSFTADTITITPLAGVPEPSTYGMLAIALLGCGSLVYRHRSKHRSS